MLDVWARSAATTSTEFFAGLAGKFPRGTGKIVTLTFQTEQHLILTGAPISPEAFSEAVLLPAVARRGRAAPSRVAEARRAREPRPAASGQYVSAARGAPPEWEGAGRGQAALEAADAARPPLSLTSAR